jgi:chemotaxis family two-component system response regulator Rcp1
MPNGNVHIMLIEDSRTDAELVAEALKDSKLPHQLELATDGITALEILAKGIKPHVILLDLNLPKKSGLEVLREIRQNNSLCAIPVVILTNSHSKSDVIQCYESFCTTYIRKPLHFEDWIAVLNCLSHFLFRVATLPRESPLSKRRGCLMHVRVEPRSSMNPPLPKAKKRTKKA